MNDPLRNGPESGRVLFDRLSHVCDGFPEDAVLNAAINLMLNVVRQRHATSTGASKELEMLHTRARVLLLDQHYDAVGRRRNLFAFNQNVDVPVIDLRGKRG